MLKNISYKVQKKNRARKYNLFIKELCPSNNDKILDVGFNEFEYRDTVNYLERHYPWQENITALGIFDEYPNFRNKYPKVNVVSYDGKNFPFKDKEFNLCWSNAVLEHVGDFDRQVLFVKELKRVSEKGFFTTPNKYFPIEIHNRTPLLHIIFSKKRFDNYLIKRGKTEFTGDNLNLLTLKRLKKVLKVAGINKYKIYRNKLFFIFTIDFVVIFKP
jgi:hypothetical protein